MARSNAFVKVYPTAWRSGTIGFLSIEEEGFYGRCLVASTALGTPLPSDDKEAAHILGVNHNKYKLLKIKLLSKGIFRQTSDGLVVEPFLPPRRSAAPVAGGFYERIPIPHELRRAVYERDGFACVRCGRETHLSCDHKIAVTSGGETSFENLETLCIPCNIAKGARNK